MEKKKKVVFRFSACLTFRDNDSTRIRVFFVSFILLTNFYRSSKIDGPVSMFECKKNLAMMCPVSGNAPRQK